MFEFIGRVIVSILACAFAIAPTAIALSLVGAPSAVVIFVPVIGAFTGRIGLTTFDWAMGARKLL